MNLTEFLIFNFKIYLWNGKCLEKKEKKGSELVFYTKLMLLEVVQLKNLCNGEEFSNRGRMSSHDSQEFPKYVIFLSYLSLHQYSYTSYQGLGFYHTPLFFHFQKPFYPPPFFSYWWSLSLIASRNFWEKMWTFKFRLLEVLFLSEQLVLGETRGKKNFVFWALFWFTLLLWIHYSRKVYFRIGIWDFWVLLKIMIMIMLSLPL